MSTEEKMTIAERRKYLRIIQKRYRPATGRERSDLLDEMEQMTGMHRKSLIRLLNGDLTRQPRHQQRGRRYGPEVDDALRVIAESMDYVCAERLQPNLVWLAQHLATHDELTLTPHLAEQLAEISISTVGRILARVRQDEPRLPRPGPKQTNRVAQSIPMHRIAWQETQPGHFEVDLVHHCGPSQSGDFMHTLQMVDVATGWSERVAILGRSYRVMQPAFDLCLARLPFPVLEIHPDNGSEFLNHHLVRFWRRAVKGVTLSRSRPYHKNDNRFVEQKNYTLVRKYLGYDRLDSVAQVVAVNQLYEQMWLYYNLFQPVMRQAEKIITPREGGSHHVTRRFDQAQTPFDRLCDTQILAPAQQQRLLRLRDQINPRQLRREIYDSIEQIFVLPGAADGGSQDIFELLPTLAPTAPIWP